MVSIKKKKIGKNEYYYLEQSFKLDGNVKKMEKYLGRNLPINIDEIQKNFLDDFYENLWFDKLNLIKKKFNQEFKNMPNIAKHQYIENFMIKFTYNSNKIEGGTITLRETAKLLEKGIVPGNKPLKDIKEVESHKNLFFDMLDYKKDLNLSIILYWHRMLFKDVEPKIAGKIRNHNVAVARSNAKFPFPAELNILLEEFFRWYNLNKDKMHPVNLAALVHLKFVSIHPFSDGNGRISRIIMNFVLHKCNFPMLNIKYINRDNYYNALERSQINNDAYIFVKHIVKRYLKEYNDYIIQS